MKTMTMFVLAMLIPLAASANPLLAGGRGALMLRSGVDVGTTDRKFGGIETDHYSRTQPWIDVLGMIPYTPRISILGGLFVGSAASNQAETGEDQFGNLYPRFFRYRYSGFVLRFSAGAVIWF